MKKSTHKRLWAAIAVASLMSASLSGCAAKEPAETPVVATESDDAATVKPLEASASDQSAETSDTAADSLESKTADGAGSSVTGENMLTNGDFSAGTDPWLTFCQDGECSIFVGSDGVLDVDIKNPGTVPHGVQLYHDGFTLEEGCVYKITFSAHSDIDRTAEMRFQLNGGDYHAYFEDHVPITTNDTPFEYTFTMEETTDPAPRFCINIGLIDGDDSVMKEHHVYFDNFVLTLIDDSQRVEGSGQIIMPDIAVNQLGYLPGAFKSATLRGTALGNTARLIDEATGEAAVEKEIDGGIFDPDTGDNEALFNFTSVAAEGTYHIESGEAVSPSFNISKDSYKEAFNAALKMLYYQRCGTELTPEFAGDFAHPVCHSDRAILYEDKSVTLDVSGGWHDAGDYGRYPVSGAKAAADIMLAYENYPEVFTDDVGIPESGNGVPDVLDEARYELDWLLKMQASDGGVYHKVTCAVFPGFIPPEDETDPLIIMPPTTTATGDFVGTMAIAARVYKDFDKAYAEKCLEAAKKSMEYLCNTPPDTVGYKNPSDISTGEYDDTCDVDERFWAFAEMYKTTGDTGYESDLSKVLPDNGYSLGWQGVAGYGGFAFLTSRNPDPSLKELILAEAEKMAKEITDNAATYPYGSTLIGEYPWGSNLSIANNGSYMLMMKDIIPSCNKDIADMQLNYLFGNNSTGYSFLTGHGTTYPDHPHHRPSLVIGKTLPGMLVGGPANGLFDPYVQNVLKGVPAAKCYADSDQSYSTNEIAVYWNSPLIYLLAGELSEAE